MSKRVKGFYSAIDTATLARLRLVMLNVGEDPRPALVAAINAGLPDLLHDPECRKLLVDVVLSAPPPKRPKGRASASVAVDARHRGTRHLSDGSSASGSPDWIHQGRQRRQTRELLPLGPRQF
jgi:hypothetical protein